MDERPIETKVTCEASLGVVWRAITDAAVMPEWYFAEIEEFRPEVGFESRFVVETDGKEYEHVWRVLKADPPTRVAYTFDYAGIPGSARVDWTLRPTDDGTEVTVVHRGLHTMPDDDPVFSREAGEQAWEHLLKEWLKPFVED